MPRWRIAIAALVLLLGQDGQGRTGGGAHASSELPPECQETWWQEFLSITSQICREGFTCMNHPLITEKAAAAMVQALPWSKGPCRIGLGSAAAFMLRSLSSRLKSVALVDLQLDSNGEARVELALSVWDSVQEMRFPLDFSFSPFPYDARTLLQSRVRTWLALAHLYSGAAKVLTSAGIPHFAWLGGMRFWSELAGALAHAQRIHSDMFPDAESLGPEHWNRLLLMPPEDYGMDIMVPAELERQLLRLQPDFEEHGKNNALERFFVHSVVPGQLVQIITNNFPEFGNGVDVRQLCPNCVVLNVYFYSELEAKPGYPRMLKVTADSAPCTFARFHLFPLSRMDDISGFPETFRGKIGPALMPRTGLNLLSHSWHSYFGQHGGSPCFWDEGRRDMEAAVANQSALGPVSRFVMRHMGPAELGAKPDDERGQDGAGGGLGSGSSLILAATDFSEEVAGLSDGTRGWFEFMEVRMGSQRPALQGFQQKVWMKRLMQERDVPIPRLLYTSEESPQLPFDGPELPQILEGYCVKPAHLAESHHTFAITATGMNLLTGENPTLEEVQGNISQAWERSLGDYDNTEGVGCAVSGVHGRYLEGRPCTNWALYNCPPGVVVEMLVKPSPFYENFKMALLNDGSGDSGAVREPPDEIKCHVIWGKVFIAEWVTPKLMLGYIFRHGFIKNTIVISPEYQRTCYGGERRDQGKADFTVCNLELWWDKVVEVAEAAVPKGVDYMRVDIFPNEWNPVVNELSVAGYSTLLEDWMLAEMMRRVKEGYRWRTAPPQAPEGIERGAYMSL